MAKAKKCVLRENNREGLRRVCRRCGHDVVSEKLLTYYPFYCPHCYENMFSFETELVCGERKKKRTQMDKSNKPVAPMPSDEFIQYMSRLTDANDHGRVYIKTAEWCRKNYPRGNRDWSDVASVFSMFCCMFKAMDRLHKKLGHFPFGSLRCAVGREMDEVIIEKFGKEVMERLNEGGRS